MSVNNSLADYYNEISTARLSPIWIKNALKNAELIKHSKKLLELKGAQPGSTAICVGAGPSLNKNVADIKGVDALIIAAESALPTLTNEGVKPDYVTVNDCSSNIAKHFLGIDTRGMKLIAPFFIDRAVSSAFRGELYFYNPVADVDAFKICAMALGELGELYSGSCVGHSMNYLAAYLGASRIANAGQDLSYPEGERYARGIRAVDENAGGQKVSVKSPDGDMLLTDERMLSYKEVFEGTLALLLKDIDFYNVTEGGLLDLGERLSLKDFRRRFDI